MKRVVQRFTRLNTFGQLFVAAFSLHAIGIAVLAAAAEPTLHPLYWFYVGLFGGTFAAIMSVVLAGTATAVLTIAEALGEPYKFPLCWLGSAGVAFGWLLAAWMVPSMGVAGMIATYVFFFAWFGTAVGLVLGFVVSGGIQAVVWARDRPAKA